MKEIRFVDVGEGITEGHLRKWLVADGAQVKEDQPLFQVCIFFALAGLQLVLLGLVAEILIRVYFDIKDKPPYFIRETVGFN